MHIARGHHVGKEKTAHFAPHDVLFAEAEIPATTAEILVNGPIALESVVIAASTTLLACIYPSWRAARMNVVDALRTNR